VKLQSPKPPPKSQPLMQYGKFCAAAGIATDAEAAPHTITAQNAFRMLSSVLTSSGHLPVATRQLSAIAVNSLSRVGRAGVAVTMHLICICLAA
jgi:hypothetical protein